MNKDNANEWDTFSWGLECFQRCQIVPLVSNINGGGLSDGKLVNGQQVVIGMNISPPLEWNQSVQQFFEDFEKNSSQLMLDYQIILNGTSVLKVSNTTELLQPQKSHRPARIVRQESGVSISSISSIKISPEFLGCPLTLLIRLSLNMSEKKQLLSHYMTMDPEEREVRQKLESNRFRGSRIPAREIVTTIQFFDPAMISFVHRELSPTSCVLCLQVQNLHSSMSIVVEDVTVQLNNTSKFICDYSNSSDSESIDPSNNPEIERLNDCPFEVTIIRTPGEASATATTPSKSSRAVSISPAEAYGFSYLIRTVSVVGDWKCVVGKFLTPFSLRMFMKLNDVSSDNSLSSTASNNSINNLLKGRSPALSSASAIDLSNVYYATWTMGQKSIDTKLRQVINSISGKSTAEDGDKDGNNNKNPSCLMYGDSTNSQHNHLFSALCTTLAPSSGLAQTTVDLDTSSGNSSSSVDNFTTSKINNMMSARNKTFSVVASQANKSSTYGFSLAISLFPAYPVDLDGEVEDTMRGSTSSSPVFEINKPITITVEITNLLSKTIRHTSIGQESSQGLQPLLMLQPIQPVSEIAAGATVTTSIQVVPLLRGTWTLENLVIHEYRNSVHSNAKFSGQNVNPSTAKVATLIPHKVLSSLELTVC